MNIKSGGNTYMYNLEMEIAHLLEELEKIELACTRQIKNAPEGKLRIAGKGNTFQCYLKSNSTADIKDNNNKKPHGQYISKKHITLAKEIAQKDYNKKILGYLSPLIAQLKRMEKEDAINKIKTEYSNLNKYRKELVTPVVLSDDEYARQWEKKEYDARVFKDSDVEIYTERGERVLSKSEKIIADKLYREGVPYMYEYPLLLDGYGTIHPDFKVLNKRNRQEYYWEHFGMMDNSDYYEKAILKIELYEKHNYIFGKNLLWTHETKSRPINMKVVNNIIYGFLK